MTSRETLSQVAAKAAEMKANGATAEDMEHAVLTCAGLGAVDAAAEVLKVANQ